MPTIKELSALPAEAYLDPSRFRTPYDGEGANEEQYAKGLKIATEFAEVHIAVNSVWSACKRSDNENASCQSYETIGYHAGTADLLRGFLAGTARIIVHRYIMDGLSKTTIKEKTQGQSLKIRDMVYIGLAYDMDTREQTKRDEYSEQIGEVQELAESDALVFIPARFAADDVSKEAWISRSRLSPARWYRICACCGSAEYVSKPQDPERGRGYGTCDRCRPDIIRDMVKCGFAGRQYTEEQAAERLARYA